MSTPSASELFMNVWHVRLCDAEGARPGSRKWDPDEQQRYWARVWLHCMELAKYLETCAQRIESVEVELAGLAEVPVDEPVDEADLE